MRPVTVVVGNPRRNPCPGVVGIEEQVSLSNSSRMRPLKLSTKAFWIGLPGAMKAGFNHPQNRKEPGDTVRWPFSTLVIALPTREDSNRAQGVPFRGDEPWKILE